MADPEHDQDVSRRYRELGRDEPPPELDAKIRAEARRAVIAHPAPLVVPTGRRTWYFPVAAAAVIVLAVAVTWQMEREQEDAFAVSPQAASGPREEARSQEEPEKQQGAKEQQRIAPLAKRAEKPAAPAPFTPEPPAAAQAPAESATGTLSVPRDREEAYGRRADRARQERPSAADPAPAPQERPPAAAQAPQRELQRDSAVSAVQGKLAEESPEQWLERIAQLRQQGRHEEADKALAEFRKRYPDYKMPEAMLEKVERK